MSPSELTAPDLSLPWSRSRGGSASARPCLTLAWSLDEPERIGEVLAVAETCCVGRGEALADDPAPRIQPLRVRPGGAMRCAPIGNARVSRVQLVLRPLGPRRLEIQSVGRTPMRVNGAETKSAEVTVGDVVELHNAAVYLVTERSVAPPPIDGSGPPPFEFGEPDAFGIVGESEAAWSLREALAFAATTDRHVLLLGESGTGKELAARAIHGLSARGGRPFVARNAATLPEGIVDAELFGNAKNYPNPGTPERAGLIGEADGSTLFLDEVGDLPERLQVHLLRALDAGGEHQRLGESKARKSNFRLVAATNRPLESLKHDFLARFTHRIQLRGLAERAEDVPLVARALLLRAAASTPSIGARFFERRGGRLAEPRITPALLVRLLRHPYVHHVRELDRLLWVAISSTRDDFLDVTPEVAAELGAAEESAASHDDAGGRDPSTITKADIEAALAASANGVTAAARALGLKNRFVLHRLIRKHGIALEGGGE